jgi:hypothetical protein
MQMVLCCVSELPDQLTYGLAALLVLVGVAAGCVTVAAAGVVKSSK